VTALAQTDGLINRLTGRFGEDAVMTEAADRAGYETDLLRTMTGRALAVVRPGSTTEVATLVRLCAEAGIGIVPQGGNTGFCAGATPPEDGSCILLSTERLTAIREIDGVGGSLVAEAGVTLTEARAAAEAAGWMLAISHGGGSARIGGTVSTNAGGANVLRHGMARAQIQGLEVVLADGVIWSGLTNLVKDNSGPDLKQLFIGGEGVFGIVTAARFSLVPRPERVATAMVAVDTPAEALVLFRMLRRQLGEVMSAAELIPRAGLELHLAHQRSKGRRVAEPFAEPHPWQVLVELATASALIEVAPLLERVLETALSDGLARDAVLARSTAQRQALWDLREGLAVAQVETPGNLKSDTSVPIAAIPDFIDRATEAVRRIEPAAVPIPFGHLGDGNIHFNVNPPPDADPEAFIGRWPELSGAIEAAALSLGGSIAAEHGIGRSKRDKAAAIRPEAATALLRRVKRAIDPAGLMNPGVVLPPE